jgi:DNA polymerase I-like protein with 3'-5' exonuclease and polymerase domains
VIELEERVSGDVVRIYVPETTGDLDGFQDFLRESGDRPLGLDTETTGLDIYAPGHRVRLVQVGNAREAWVLDPERFHFQIFEALRGSRRFYLHNATYDALVLDRHGLADALDLLRRSLDTYTLAHLLDPRPRAEGGSGLKLKELAEIYVDPEAKDAQTDLIAVFHAHGFTKETGYAGVPLEDRTYLRYAGLDPIYAFRLAEALIPFAESFQHLQDFERDLQVVLAGIQRRGVLVDVDYTRSLSEALTREAEIHGARTAQVAAGLEAMGEELTETTATGKPKVDSAVLLYLADLDKDWQRVEAREPNPLADAVIRTKRAGKWRESYTDAFLRLRDSSDRLHPSINGLAARTARMSISMPPLQQLPSGEARIRRCLLADEGHVLLAADYSQVEMRILAALSEDPKMMAAIAGGEDLHEMTARAAVGEEVWASWTPAQRKRARKLFKGVGFGKVYGGGKVTLSRQTGASITEVAAAIAKYDRLYPGIKRYSKRLQTRAQYGAMEVVTPSGRHLPLDRSRVYSATNYVIQSTARDAFAQAILELDDAGLSQYILLPVHDELVCSAPFEDAADVLHAIQSIMTTSFRGVTLATDGSLGIRSWGSLYGAEI